MLNTRDGSQGVWRKWAVAAIAFAIPWCVLAARDTRLTPEGVRRLGDADPTRRLKEWRPSDSATADTLLVTWEGSTCDDPRTTRFAEGLTGQEDVDGVRRGGAPEITRVITASEAIERLTVQGIDQETAVERLTGTVIGGGGLKLRLTEAGRETRDATLARLVRSARMDLQVDLQVRNPIEAWADDTGSVATPAIEMQEYDAEVTWNGFTARSTTFAQIRALALGLSDFPTTDEPRGRKLIAEAFMAPGAPVAVQIELSSAGTADLTAAIAAIKRAASDADIDNLHIVGEPLTRLEQSRAAANVLWNTATPSPARRSLPVLVALVTLALSCLVMRSVRQGLLLTVLASITVLLMLGLLRLMGANLDPVLLAAPLYAGLLILACGVQISWQGPDDDTTARLQTLVARQRTTLIIAAAVMFPLGISSTPVVRQVGLLGAAGALLAALLSTLALPVLSALSRGNHARLSATGGPWGPITDGIARRPRLAGLLCGVLLLAGASGLSRMQIQSSDVRLLPSNSQLAADTQFIEENLTGAAALDIVVRFGSESQNELRFVERTEVVRAVEAAVRQHPSIAGTYSLADLLPVVELPAANAPTRQRVMFARQSNEIEEQVRSGQVAGAESLLTTAVRDADWQTVGDGRLSRVGDELWRISTRATLPAGLNVLQVTRDIDMSIQQILRRHPGADHVIAGPAVFAAATRIGMLKSQSKTLLLASVFLIGALIWTLRSPTGIVIGMTTNVLPIACVLGVGSLRGMQIDVEVLLAALLSLALSGHLTSRLLLAFRDGLLAGETHVAAMRRALTEGAGAHWRFAMITVGIALALRATDLAAVRSFSGLFAAMTATHLLTTLVLLPAMLAGRIGRWLQAGTPAAEPLAAGLSEALPSPHVRFEPAPRDLVRPAV